MSKKFTIRYLPLFEKDLSEAKDYIVNVLKNPSAALRLIENTETAILKRLEQPLAFAAYDSVKKRSEQYYRIFVGNFTVFYVVIGNVMEVRRFIFNKRDLSKLL